MFIGFCKIQFSALSEIDLVKIVKFETHSQVVSCNIKQFPEWCNL